MPGVSRALESGSSRVGSGILLSRLFGLLRERAVAHYFGVGPFADVIGTVLRGPNLLQNLLGEQSLSASFIPIYSRLLGEGRRHEAGRFAGAIFGLLLSLAAGLALVGVLAARPVVALLAPGYLADADLVARGQLAVDRFELAVRAVRWVFPMAGLLVLSAWALGILNSHGRFFLPYFAPVLWNSAIIAALVAAASLWGMEAGGLVIALCVGALVGGALQFAVQLPVVWRQLRGFAVRLSMRVEGVAEAVRSFWPVLASRGVVQLSGYLDLVLASLLTAGALGALGWAQRLYFLPIALFAMAVAAAELPGLARARGRGVGDEEIGERLSAAQATLMRASVPVALAYLGLGFLVVGALYRTGSFSIADTWLVYLVLAAYSLGLVATSVSRLLVNAFYALGDTRRPSRVAVARVFVSVAFAVPLMLLLDRVGLESVVGDVAMAEGRRLGAVGLAVAASVGAWFELWRLRRQLRLALPAASRFPWRQTLRSTGNALAALLPAGLVWWLLPSLHPILEGGIVLGVYGAAYLTLVALVDWRR